MTKDNLKPPCIVCNSPSRTRGLCATHYSRWLAHGDPFKVDRPEDWGKRNKHPLNHTWRWTYRSKQGRVERWNDFYLFLEDVGERPSESHKLRRYDIKKPFGPDNFFWLQCDAAEETMTERQKKAWYQKQWREKNPEKSKAITLKKQFGIGFEQYTDMALSQGGGCAICGGKDEHRALAVDHCHETNKVRGLLCSFCNRGIGLFRDLPDRMEAAAAYVRKHK